MIKVKAKITLYPTGRKTPFKSGYRPLFNFIDSMKTSGQITLIKGTGFAPGQQDIVEVAFLNEEYLGDNFVVGRKFTFGEGRESLGDGEILEII